MCENKVKDPTAFLFYQGYLIFDLNTVWPHPLINTVTRFKYKI